LKPSEKITIRLPETYIRMLDFLVEADDSSSRSEAIREAIRNYVYDRVDLVSEKLDKIRVAEEKLAGVEAMKREYLRQ